MENRASVTYKYCDELGRLLYTKVRACNADGAKTFYCEREENGVVIRNLDGCRKVLYQLQTIITAIRHNKTIFLVEGEKDANTLLSHTLMATTAPGTLEWQDEWTKILEKADVVILYDYDRAGVKRRDLLCEKLYGNVKRLRVVELPGLEMREKHGQDITDWLEMGNAIEGFKALIGQAPDYLPSQDSDSSLALKVVSLDQLLNLKLPERKMLLAPFLPSQGLVLLVAKRGVGKTHIALGVAYAVASGGTFLKWAAPEAKRVLYIDGEMPAVLMQERLRMIEDMSDAHPAEGYLRLLTPDLQQRVMPDLSQKGGRDAIEPLLADVDLVIIDNISCTFRSGSENESESWQEAQEWALSVRRQGKSILFVHHAGKSGNQRGTSKREDILDAVITLKHTEDYKQVDGARFEIIFDKARHFSGSDACSFQVQLKSEGTKRWWELSDTPEDEELEQIAGMRNSNKTLKQIAEDTKLTKSQVEYRLAKAKQKGLIK